MTIPLLSKTLVCINMTPLKLYKSRKFSLWWSNSLSHDDWAGLLFLLPFSLLRKIIFVIDNIDDKIMQTFRHQLINGANISSGSLKVAIPSIHCPFKDIKKLTTRGSITVTSDEPWWDFLNVFFVKASFDTMTIVYFYSFCILTVLISVIVVLTHSSDTMQPTAAMMAAIVTPYWHYTVVQIKLQHGCCIPAG